MKKLIQITIVGYWALRAVFIWGAQEQVSSFFAGSMAACIAALAALIYFGYEGGE